MGRRYSTYLPQVSSGEVANSYQVAKLVMTAGWQKREEPFISPVLMKMAQERADDMARRDYFSHTTPDGRTPNEHVRALGYALPSWYREKGNNIESIYIGHDEPEEPVRTWFDSPKHHDHVTGDSSFYASQRAVGVGTAKAKDGRQLYVLVSAP